MKLNHLVGKKTPNSFSLSDMNGNVAERVQYCWDENYLGAPYIGVFRFARDN
jgi:formylglycine-generating enzyme required for sulfatase activity